MCRLTGRPLLAKVRPGPRPGILTPFQCSVLCPVLLSACLALRGITSSPFIHDEAGMEWVPGFLVKLAHLGKAEADETQPEAWAVILAPG